MATRSLSWWWTRWTTRRLPSYVLRRRGIDHVVVVRARLDDTASLPPRPGPAGCCAAARPRRLACSDAFGPRRLVKAPSPLHLRNRTHAYALPPVPGLA